jgi:hypothetical protein
MRERKEAIRTDTQHVDHLPPQFKLQQRERKSLDDGECTEGTFPIVKKLRGEDQQRTRFSGTVCFFPDPELGN